MSHFLRENEYQRQQQQQQHCIYGHGNRTNRPKGLQQQQEIDDGFDGTNYTINNKTGNRKTTETNTDSACDSGSATKTIKTATILVSKTKMKPGLPVLPKHQ